LKITENPYESFFKGINKFIVGIKSSSFSSFNSCSILSIILFNSNIIATN